MTDGISWAFTNQLDDYSCGIINQIKHANGAFISFACFICKESMDY